jgi:putative chitinase
MTLEQLEKVMRTASRPRLIQCLPHLQLAMLEFEINTRLREAAFVAQLALESGELRYFREIRGEKQRYAPYFGRGAIQLTWEKNYRACGDALGVDLVGNPELAATLPFAFRVSGWFWQSRALNRFADLGMDGFERIVQRVNGGRFVDGKLIGANHVPERRAYYERALEALGVRVAS